MIALKRLLLIPTKSYGYQNVYKRAYDITANMDTLRTVENLFISPTLQKSANIPITAVANSLSNVAKLSAYPTNNKPVYIPNGWGTQRLRFLLETEENKNGVIEVAYIQGYTEYSDLSMSGRIDPAMKFYINSISTVKKIQQPNGGISFLPSTQFNVIYDIAGNQVYQELSELDETEKLIRPKDLIEGMLTMNMYGDQFTNVIDTTSNLNSSTHASSKVNNNPISYLTKTMNGYLTGKVVSDISYDTTDILKNASYHLSEPEISKLGFIQELYRITHIIQSTVFDASVLEAIDPSIGTRTHLINYDTAALQSNSYLHNTSVLDTDVVSETLNPTIENRKAVELVYGINSIMAENLLSRLDVGITNISGELMVTPLYGSSFMDGVDVTRYIDRAITLIRTLLGPSLTEHNNLLVQVLVSSEMVSDTTISISVNNGPEVVYRYPTFADSLYSPVIANSAIKDDLESAVSTLFDATYGTSDSFHMNSYGA